MRINSKVNALDSGILDASGVVSENIFNSAAPMEVQVAYPVVLFHNLEEPVLGLVGSRTTFWGNVKVTGNFLMMRILCCVAISLL